MKTPGRISRRLALKRSAVAALAASGLPSFFASRLQGAGGAGDRITIGCIGMGGHGVSRNLRMLLGQQDARVVAVCDVFTDRRDKAQRLVDKQYGGKGCAAVTDFRRILGRKDIDAVMISTPDHWHTLMSVTAMRQGKDVICEKPTLTIHRRIEH